MNLNSTLSGIINGQYEFCSLCHCTVEHNNIVYIHDEIICDGFQDTLTITNILAYILGSEFLGNSSKYDALCNQCRRQAVESYTFIKMCKQNSDNLHSAIMSLNNYLQDVTLNWDNSFNCKSIFVQLNTTDFTVDTNIDYKHTKGSRRDTLKRFRHLKKKMKTPTVQLFHDADIHQHEISDTEIHNDVYPKKLIQKAKCKRVYNSVAIPTCDMMLDKNGNKCKVCFKTYSSSQHLRQHYIRMHAAKQFKCPECPRRYGSETLLEQHKYDSHSPAVCTECGKEYVNRQSLKLHELGHRTKLNCLSCGRTYKTHSTYRKHVELNICQQKVRKSNLEAKFTCDYCNKRFCHKPTLRVHIQFEHGTGKVHICTWCNKKFHAQSRLKAHIVKHTQEKKFGCDLCGGKFVTKESLIYHTRIHTGERPYQCDLCDSSFLSSSRRAEHVRRNHLGVTFECDICHNKFKGRSCLQKHKQRHYNPKSRLHCLQNAADNGVS